MPQMHRDTASHADRAEPCAQAIYDRLLVLQKAYPVGGVLLLPACSLPRLAHIH